MLPQSITDHLINIVGANNALTSTADLYTHGFDASIHHHTPDIILRPRTAQEIQKIVTLANKQKIPLVPRGAGTALSGQAVPLHAGIVLDITRMDTIKTIRIPDLYCIVEPGVIYGTLNQQLAKHNFFFPPTPGSGDICTIGGMVAINASGMRAIKYGATRDYVLGMDVILPNGDFAQLGTKTLKNSSGYQLERLMVGSEGTLGVITEVTLRISPLPQKRTVALASYTNLEKAGEGVSSIIAQGVIPSALEIMDSVCIKAVNKAMKLDLPDAAALLLIEADGATATEDIQHIAQICKSTGAESITFTDDKKEMQRLWQGRKGVLPSLSRYGDSFVSVSLADDMSVPISRIPQAIVAFQDIAHRHGIIIGTYGHAGDGNLHTKVLLDPNSKSHWRHAEKAVDEIFRTVLKLEGTVSGEHGIGISKAPWMKQERHLALEAMEKIKNALDENNIMNPGKMGQWKGSIISHLRYPWKQKEN
jgi:glycolate oxidase